MPKSLKNAFHWLTILNSGLHRLTMWNLTMLPVLIVAFLTFGGVDEYYELILNHFPLVRIGLICYWYIWLIWVIWWGRINLHRRRHSPRVHIIRHIIVRHHLIWVRVRAQLRGSIDWRAHPLAVLHLHRAVGCTHNVHRIHLVGVDWRTHYLIVIWLVHINPHVHISNLRGWFRHVWHPT